MTDCPHTCCFKITAGRANPKQQERKHTHVYKSDDCPSCFVAGRRLEKGS